MTRPPTKEDILSAAIDHIKSLQYTCDQLQLQLQHTNIRLQLLTTAEQQNTFEMTAKKPRTDTPQTLPNFGVSPQPQGPMISKFRVSTSKKRSAALMSILVSCL